MAERRGADAWLRTGSVALLVAGSVALITAVAANEPKGNTEQATPPARRVVTLAPHLTELVFAAGGGDRVVGVMRYSDFPAAALALPVIGDAFAINLEAIASLKPDLVLAWRSGTNQRQRDRLQALQVRVVDNEIERVEDIGASLRQIGRLLGTQAAAQAAAEKVEQRWHRLLIAHVKDKPVRVFYQLWAEPLMTVSRSHLVDQAISACGGVNVFADQPGMTPTVGWEAVARANPQIVIATSAQDEPAQLAGWQKLTRVDAVRHHHLVTLDGHTLARMTPRFLDAAEALCAAIGQARDRR